MRNVLLQYPVHLVEAGISDHLTVGASDRLSMASRVVRERGSTTRRIGEIDGTIVGVAEQIVVAGIE